MELTQEQAHAIAESIWGDIAFTQFVEEDHVTPYRVGWKTRHETPSSSTFYGDSWYDAVLTIGKCVSQPGWPDPYYPNPDEAAYILQRLGWAGITEF